jgi:hypothetical protein
MGLDDVADASFGKAHCYVRNIESTVGHRSGDGNFKITPGGETVFVKIMQQ